MNRREAPEGCQPRRAAALLAGALLLAGCSGRIVTPSPGRPGCPAPPPPALRGVVRGLDAARLPRPRAMEIAAVPDRSAGMSFAGVIRLQPLPPPVALATLMHEVGHLGPDRERPVEEAVAVATRWALTLRLAGRSPARAAPLLPGLVTGFGIAHPAAGEAPGDAAPPLSAAVYREAARIAVALHGAAPGSGWKRWAAVAWQASGTPSRDTRARVEALLPRDEFAPAAARLLQAELIPLLRSAPLSGPSGPLADLLEQPGVPRHLDRYIEAAIAGSATDRDGAHAVVLELAPSEEASFLSRWVDSAVHRGDLVAASEGRTRRSRLRVRAGEHDAARDDLLTVLSGSPDPLQAATALVELSRVQALGEEELDRLMVLSPALRGCGSSELQAHVALLAGQPGMAAARFARVPDAGFSAVLGWAQAVARSGAGAEAARILLRAAEAWEQRRRTRPLAAAAILAASALHPVRGCARLEQAATWIGAGRSGFDRALVEAAACHEQQGDAAAARQVRRRLREEAPRSDLVLPRGDVSQSLPAGAAAPGKTRQRPPRRMAER